MKTGQKLLTNSLKCAKILSSLVKALEVYVIMKEFPGTALNTLVLSLVIVLLISLKELLAVGVVSGHRA
jgi:hypothetical protein